MKVGIVGVGSWGSRVVSEYLTLKEQGIISDVAVFDTDSTKLKKYDSNEVSIFARLPTLLDNVDCIHICTPNSFHFSVATFAMEKGVHVLVEKPMSTTSKEAYKMIEIASKNGVILQVGHIFRFANVIRKIKELYEENKIGSILYATLQWTTFMQPPMDLDIRWDLLPHPIDILHYITDEWPSVFKANEVGTPPFVSLNLLGYSCFPAYVEASWRTPERKRLLKLVGTDATALVQCVKQELSLIRNNGKVQEIPVEDNNTILSEVSHFIESIKNNRMPFNSHIIGARNVEIIEKIIGYQNE